MSKNSTSGVGASKISGVAGLKRYETVQSKFILEKKKVIQIVTVDRYTRICFINNNKYSLISILNLIDHISSQKDERFIHG